MNPEGTVAALHLCLGPIRCLRKTKTSRFASGDPDCIFFMTSLSPNSQSSPIPSPKCLGVLLCQILILDQVLICNWHYCIWQPRFYVKCNSTRLSTASLVCPCNRRTIVKTRRYIIFLLPISGVDLEFMALSLSGVYTDWDHALSMPESVFARF